MTLTTKTAQRLKEHKEYVANHKHFANLFTKEMIDEIISFKNVLDWDDVNNVPMEIDTKKISLLIQEIEMVEKGK